MGKALAKLAVTEEESQGSQAPAQLPVVEEALPKAARKRKLEATVSLDSEGYPRAKKKLIVEVTEARSPRYLEIGEKLMKGIKTKDLSKKDAVALREKLVLKHPAALGPSS